MQPEQQQAGYARVPVPMNTPPVAGDPVNGQPGPPRPRPALDDGPGLTRVSRWVLERGIDADGEPLRFAVDAECRIVTVTFADVDHVVSWGLRFEADRPARLPADRHIGYPIVQTHIVRNGWTVVFRCVEDGQ